jgi:O-antigen/teichoic acid export membrane protein
VSSAGDSALRRNTRASMAAWTWGQGLNFIRMMVLLDFLSANGYGLWIFAFSIIGYFTIYNFGIANAFVNYTAQLHARGAHARLNGLLSTGVALNGLLAGAIVLMLVFFREQALVFFRMRADNLSDGSFVLLGVGLTSSFAIATSVYGGVLTGLQRLDVRNYTQVAVGTVEFGMSVLLLNLGFGIRAVVVAYGLSVVVTNLMFAYQAHRLLPQLRLSPRLMSTHHLHDLFSLGARMQLLGIMGLLVASLDLTLFMYYGGAAFVGAYGAAQKFAQRAQGVALQGYGALAPASADLHARHDHEGLTALYGTAQRLSIIGCAWMFAYLAVNSDIVMLFVMDEQFEHFSAYALSVLCIGYFIHTLTGPGSSMLRGAGRTFQEILYQALTVVIFGALFVAAGGLQHRRETVAPPPAPEEYHSFFQAALDAAAHSTAVDPEMLHQRDSIIISTWPIALASASLIFIFIANNFFKAPAFAPFDTTAYPLLASLLIAWSTHVLLNQVFHFSQFQSRWPAFVAILVTGMTYTVVSLPLIWRLPGLTAEDKQHLIAFVPGGRRLARLGGGA